MRGVRVASLLINDPQVLVHGKPLISRQSEGILLPVPPLPVPKWWMAGGVIPVSLHQQQCFAGGRWRCERWVSPISLRDLGARGTSVCKLPLW